MLLKGTLTNGRRYVLLPLLRFAWLDYGELRYNEAMQQIIDAHRNAAREGSGQSALKTAARVEEELGKTTGLEVPRSRMRALTMPSLMKLTNKAARFEAQKAMAMAAIALHRHRLRHGRWPATLAAPLQAARGWDIPSLFDRRQWRGRWRPRGIGTWRQAESPQRP